MRLLFVCLGNICRSPAAEAVMNHLIQEAGLQEHFSCDSAGISDYHKGEPADPRMIKALKRRGYESHSLSRPVDPRQDFDSFDLILAMDKQNLAALESLRPKRDVKAKIRLICDFCRTHKIKETPDPYYGSTEGFDYVIDILEDSCRGLLAALNDNSMPI
jgi:protein-tyrosine phosphatase